MGKDLKGKDIGKGLSQRKDGRYEARAVIKGTKINLYNVNLAQLRKDFETEKANVIKGKLGDMSNYTLSEWFNRWFETYKKPRLKSEASIRSYHRKIANTYVRILGSKRVRDITPVNVQDATNQLMEEKYVYRTIREGLNVLKECIDFAIVNNIAFANPCIDIEITTEKTPPKERRVLDDWERKLYLDVARGGFYYEAYAILLLTGMRIGEFSALQWSDVDFFKKEISISKSLSVSYVNGKKIEKIGAPKTINAYRKIPFFDNIEELFKSWRLRQAEYKESAGTKWRCDPSFGDLVFTTTLGSTLNRYNIIHDIANIEKTMRYVEMDNAIKQGRAPREVKHIHPHAFRHTFATVCFEKQLDPLFIQKIMGHSDYKTTTRYTHLLNELVQKQVNKTKGFLD